MGGPCGAQTPLPPHYGWYTKASQNRRYMHLRLNDMQSSSSARYAANAERVDRRSIK